MWFLALGVLLMGLKLAEVGPVAEWPWWQTMVPLGLAVLWWTWADFSGYTKRKRMEKELSEAKNALALSGGSGPKAEALKSVE